VSILCSCGSSSSPTAPAPAPTKIVNLQGNLAFGNVVVGSKPTSSLTITNSGNASLTVTGLTGPTGYTASWTSGVVPAGSSQNVTIGFAPTSAGSYNGTITVVSDQTSGSNSIPVSGTAFANLSGGWAGTETASASGTSIVCNMTWIVNSQTAGQFSGTWQTSGNSCGQAGNMTGTISSTNSFSGLNFNATVGTLPNGCSRVAGDGLFSGPLSGNNALVQSSDTIRCPGIPDIVRSITLSMNKQ
jgi:hypothetical protein